MRLLAIDTSGRSQGVAAMLDDELLHESLIFKPTSHSETLLASIEAAMQEANWRLEDIEAYALTVGPGSFTGLRIGLSTVKGLCMVHPRPVAGISTLQALAYPLLLKSAWVIPCLDARGGEVFSAVYSNDQGFPTAVVADRAWPIEEWLESLSRLPGAKLLVGDAVQTYQKRLEAISDLAWAEEGTYDQVSPLALAKLGMRVLRQGGGVSAAGLKPEYLRVSEAENRLRRSLETKGGNHERQ